MAYGSNPFGDISFGSSTTTNYGLGDLAGANLGDPNAGNWGDFSSGGGWGGFDASGTSLMGSNDLGYGSGFSSNPSLADSFGSFNNSVNYGNNPAAQSFNPQSFLQKIGSVLSPELQKALGIAQSTQAFAKDPSLKNGIGVASRMAGGTPMGSILGMAASKDPGASWGSGFGSMLGGAMLGPLGAIGGSMLGGGVLAGANPQGDKVSPEGLAGNQGDSILDKMGGVGGAANTLAQLYAMSQAGKGEGSAGQGNAAVQQQISQLGDMYGQNSPYAQALRQQLERKDAAAGRRSQYGPREVELQAQLAKMAAGNAQTIGNLATSNQANQLALRKQQEQRRGQQLSTLLSLGKSTGAFNALGSMFNGGSSGGSVMNTPYNTSSGSLLDGYSYGDTGGGWGGFDAPVWKGY